jgi:hypothetical protein
MCTTENGISLSFNDSSFYPVSIKRKVQKIMPFVKFSRPPIHLHCPYRDKPQECSQLLESTYVAITICVERFN